MSATVAQAEATQAEAIATVAQEMDLFYGATDLEPLHVRLRQIEEAVFGDPPSSHALLAWDSGKPIGLATYSLLWPAVDLTRSLFIKEIYVMERARRTGVGRQLMRALFDVATDQRCSRVEWQTETTNEAARRFYADLGASAFEGKVFYRMESEAIQATKQRLANRRP